MVHRSNLSRPASRALQEIQARRANISDTGAKIDRETAAQLVEQAIKEGVVKVDRITKNGRKPYLRKRYTGY